MGGGLAAVTSPVLRRDSGEFVSWHGAPLYAALRAAVRTEIVRGDDAVGANSEPLPAPAFEGIKKLQGWVPASLAFKDRRRPGAEGVSLRVFLSFLSHD